MVRRLRDDGLVDYTRSEGLRLTTAGAATAARVVRKHRLVELFLARELGLPLEEVHMEAERLEHVISDRVGERLNEMLGRPTRDPHGHPIPTSDGRIDEPATTQLLSLEPGVRAVISRVPDSDAGTLRYLGEMGMFPGAQVEVLAIEPYGGSLRLMVSGADRSIGRELAGKVYVNTEVEEK
jgi:DtxR family Mn-dependent transcriptional regulator